MVKSGMLYVIVMLVALLPLLIDASCQCSACGDPHYVMCDQKARFDFMDQGLFTAFKTDDVEVQLQQSFPRADVDKKFLGNGPGNQMQFSHVDYCLIRVKRDGCTFVMQTATQDDKNSGTINGVKMPVGELSGYVQKNVDPKLKVSVNMVEDKNEWAQSIAVASVNFMSGDSQVTVDCGPEYFAISAPGVNKCSGLCGTCSGAEQVPTKPDSYAATEKISGKGGCDAPAPSSKPSAAPTSMPAASSAAPTSKPSASSAPPTSKPAASSAAPTSKPSASSAPPTSKPAAAPPTSTPAGSGAPSTKPASSSSGSAPSSKPSGSSSGTPSAKPSVAPSSKPENKTEAPTAPLPPVEKCNGSIIVGHPTFESEKVLKEVVEACMCGQPKERMANDAVFAAFVENCIYDKSLGPGVESLAQSNMWAFLRQNKMAEDAGGNQGSSTGGSSGSGKPTSGSPSSSGISGAGMSSGAGASGSKPASSGSNPAGSTPASGSSPASSGSVSGSTPASGSSASSSGTGSGSTPTSGSSHGSSGTGSGSAPSGPSTSKPVPSGSGSSPASGAISGSPSSTGSSSGVGSGPNAGNSGSSSSSKGVSSSGSKANSNSGGSKSGSGSSSSTPAPKFTSGNFTLGGILRPHVSMASLDIPAGTGCTYQLMFNKPPVFKGWRHPALSVRDVTFRGSAEEPVPFIESPQDSNSYGGSSDDDVVVEVTVEVTL